MSDFPSQINGPLGPTPDDSQEEFRAFLRHVVAEQFDGNVSKMAAALAEVGGIPEGTEQNNFRRKMSRILSYDVQTVDAKIIRWTWSYLFKTYGLQAFDYAPDLLGSRLLPVVLLSAERTDAERADAEAAVYQVTSQIKSRYSIDKVEFRNAYQRTDRRRFVTVVESDAMEPQFHAGDCVIVEHMEHTDQLVQPGVYLFRMESAVQIARLQPREHQRMEVMFPNDSYKDYTLDRSKVDVEILGRVWGSFRRT
jgi:hypothetical protein